MTDALPFAPGDKVHKATGSYKQNGVVRAVYPLGDGSLRVTVEHDADVEGTFVHHYPPSALAQGWLPTREMALAELVLSMELVTDKGLVARRLARSILAIDDHGSAPDVILVVRRGTVRLIRADDPAFPRREKGDRAADPSR